MRLFLTILVITFVQLAQVLSGQELDYPSQVFDTGTHKGHCLNMGTYPGVDPTGATDSTIGIQNAIYYMYIQNGGGVPRQETLYFPNGTYLISGTLDAMWSENTTGNTSTASNTLTTGTITNLATTANVRAGNTLVCADFPAGTTVTSVNASTATIVVNHPSTGTHTGIAVGFQNPLYRMHFVGQSEAGVTIKLGNAVKTSTADFTNSASPQSMIKTESDGNSGNDAFDNCVWDMTVDTGTNNPGAVGIDYLGNNCASVRNVTIKAATGSGYAGLEVTRAYPGPCMIENVNIAGFATGVLVGHAEYGATFETLTLSQQTSVGISNSGNALFIRGLASTNTNAVPVITNGSSGLLVLVDSTASYNGGGVTTANAINNVSGGTNCGGAFIRNFVTTNYALAVSNPNTGGSNTTGNAANGTVKEYTTHPVLTPGLAGSGVTSLNLTVQPTPVFVDNNFANWYSVGNKIAPDTALQDESTQIQAAIDAAATAGADTLYFPPGKYYLANPVYLHGSIRRVLGFGSVLMPFVPSSGSGAFDSTHAGNLQPIISVGGGPLGDVTNSVEFDQFTVYPTSGYGFACYFCDITQNTSKTVTLTDMELVGGAVDSNGAVQQSAYQGMTSVGNLFLDDDDGSGWYFTHPGQQVWARQLDPEGDTAGTPSNYQAKITNTGSTLWILGLKTEAYGTLVESTANAATEVLGCFGYPVHAVSATYPQSKLNNNLFDVQNSDFSACYVTFGGSSGPDYPNQVGETEGTQTATLYDYTSTSTPAAYLRVETGSYSMVPLVVASPSLAIPGIDIGSVGVAGTASLASGVYTVKGSGADIFGKADAFHFCSENIAGDCTIIAKVTSLQNTNANAKAAVMIRDTIAPGSIDALCDMTPSAANFITRSATNASAVDVAYKTRLTIPYWIKLVRSGNNFSAYRSPDDVTWTQIGTTQSVTMGSVALVGLGVTACNNSVLCTATFSNLTITSP